jgi:hypothetical protein
MLMYPSKYCSPQPRWSRRGQPSSHSPAPRNWERQLQLASEEAFKRGTPLAILESTPGIYSLPFNPNENLVNQFFCCMVILQFTARIGGNSPGKVRLTYDATNMFSQLDRIIIPVEEDLLPILKERPGPRTVWDFPAYDRPTSCHSFYDSAGTAFSELRQVDHRCEGSQPI